MAYYLKRNWLLLAGGAVVGLALALYVGLTARSLEIILGSMVCVTLVTWPFSVRSPVGRVWWAAWLLVLIGLVGVRMDHLHTPLGYALAGLVAFSNGVAVCLRWRPPVQAGS